MMQGLVIGIRIISLGSQGKGHLSRILCIGLSPSTIYHYRFSGTNFNGATGGVSWSNTETFHN